MGVTPTTKQMKRTPPCDPFFASLPSLQEERPGVGLFSQEQIDYV